MKREPAILNMAHSLTSIFDILKRSLIILTELDERRAKKNSFARRLAENLEDYLHLCKTMNVSSKR